MQQKLRQTLNRKQSASSNVRIELETNKNVMHYKEA